MMKSVISTYVGRLHAEQQARISDKAAAASAYEKRLKENPLGVILSDHLSWIYNSNLFTEEQQKAARMISICKTEALGGYMEYCPECDKVVDFHYCSCNNRNCPHCQYPMQEKWVEMRKNEVIPGIPYYHIILTCPHDLNPLFKSNPKLLLSLLMRSTSKAVITICKDPKVLGAVPSILSVLHTWTSDLKDHFHNHMLVSGGGLNPDGKFVSLTDLRTEQKQRRKQKDGDSEDSSTKSAEGNGGNDYFFSMAALTALFRGIFMAELRKLYNGRQLTIPEEIDELNDPDVWSRFCYKLEQKSWVGDLEKTTAQGENVIEYFSRYAYRTAISNSRIVSYDGKNVEFTVRDKNAPSGKKNITLDVRTFITRYLSHVLPKGFTRVRTFGLLSNAQKKKKLQSIHDQLNLKPFESSPLQDMRGLELMQALYPDRQWGKCPHCQAQLTPVAYGMAGMKELMIRRRNRRRAA